MLDIAFYISSGVCGLNLIGVNRLLMIDADWNVMYPCYLLVILFFLLLPIVVYEYATSLVFEIPLPGYFYCSVIKMGSDFDCFACMLSPSKVADFNYSSFHSCISCIFPVLGVT